MAYRAGLNGSAGEFNDAHRILINREDKSELYAVAAEMAAAGHLAENGKPATPSSVTRIALADLCAKWRKTHPRP